MSNLPVRGLGAVGIIADLNPYDLPPNAISAGVNVRFENNKVTRGPVMREVWDYGLSFSPGYLFSIPPVVEGNDQIVAISDDGSKILSIMGSAATDISPIAPTVSTTDDPWTHTQLGAVTYLNRKDRQPLQLRSSDAQFTNLNGWDASWRCGSLRAYKDFLLALGVTKGGTEYPTMVKWSDIAQFGGPPASWDETSTTNSAGENIVNEMRSPIVDGLTLRDGFIIYCQNEVWLMTYIGGNFLFQFRKLYDRAGVINANCVTQVDGIHFVFDRNDIYVNDGATKRSIVHGKNKDFIFQGLIKDKRNQCFVAHNPHLNEVMFCYPSEDRFAAFSPEGGGCNRAAVYNPENDTWSFYDLPNVTAATLSNIPTGEGYETVGEVIYENFGGTYKVAGDNSEQHLLFTGMADDGSGLTSNRLYGLDMIGEGKLPKPLSLETLKPAFIERVGIDLDESGLSLPTYKALHTIYPQLGLEGNSPVQFQFGASDIVGQEPPWGFPQNFDPRVSHKVDTNRVAGRYLAYRMTYSGTGDFAFSGLDARIVARGRRG